MLQKERIECSGPRQEGNGWVSGNGEDMKSKQSRHGRTRRTKHTHLSARRVGHSYRDPFRLDMRPARHACILRLVQHENAHLACICMAPTDSLRYARRVGMRCPTFGARACADMVPLADERPKRDRHALAHRHPRFCGASPRLINRPNVMLSVRNDQTVSYPYSAPFTS